MEDTVKTNLVTDLAKLLEEHRGTDVLALDLRAVCSWTDYFIITTTSSQTHVKGILKHIRTFLSSQNLEILHRQKHVEEEGWILIDCGFTVIHLMNEETRRFYELEKLWHTGSVIYHSSKSS
ncbi:MAG: ribosome silencing factor [Spirochaetales bacterium]|nr:ribosome silencing factor [Spirochaetales bacterium]